jgi:hypothetical protein
MSYEVAVAGALIGLLLTVGAAGFALWVGVRMRAAAPGSQTDTAVEPDRPASPASADADPPSDRSDLDERSGSALTACVFEAAPVDHHLGWTAMVVDPALRDTPSHVRLVGYYDTELAAVDAAANLADALNECLIPGEAPLTATALAIEPANGCEPRSHIRLPMAYTASPLDSSNTVLTDLDGAPLSR